MSIEKQLSDKYSNILAFLDEKQKRIVLAGDAILLGRGGVSIVSRASKISRPTIHRGIKELSENQNKWFKWKLDIDITSGIRRGLEKPEWFKYEEIK